MHSGGNLQRHDDGGNGAPSDGGALMTAPIQSGSIGELFWRVNEAVILIDSDRVIAFNPAAQRMFGVAPDTDARADEVFGPILGTAYDQLRALIREPGTAVIDAMSTCGLVLDVKSWPIEGSDVRMLIVTDVTAGRRLSDGLTRLSALGRDLLVGEPDLRDLLQQLVEEAQSVARADFSALLLVHPHNVEAITHFATNGSEEFFPEGAPRPVGLLGVPLRQGTTVCVDDVHHHPDGLGVDGSQAPTIGPLLATPIMAGDLVIGEIAVANAPGGARFDDVDRQLLVDLAAHAGIAVRWAESRERARATQEARAEIIATARHDIRNPLTIGKGYMAMLEQKRDRLSDEQIAAALTAVREAFQRIEDFASRALMSEDDVAQPDAPEWTTIPVKSLLQSLAADHTAAARDVGTNVVTSWDESTPDQFVADVRMVREVLDNLVTNAIKYGLPLSDVTIAARGEGDRVRFEVHNHGDGISPEDQQRIFEPYWRTEDARKGSAPGTGLGLSIVRRYVTLHDGAVGVSSREKEGTTFWVTFPVERPQDGSA
jgi:signal transduction histidine kinase